jgi:hypothetical protein
MRFYFKNCPAEPPAPASELKKNWPSGHEWHTPSRPQLTAEVDGRGSSGTDGFNRNRGESQGIGRDQDGTLRDLSLFGPSRDKTRAACGLIAIIIVFLLSYKNT